jgi:hypothetical protein
LGDAVRTDVKRIKDVTGSKNPAEVRSAQNRAKLQNRQEAAGERRNGKKIEDN